MAPLKRSKTDANDAAAIREAVTRPSMRFVAIKTKVQQAALMLQRALPFLRPKRTSRRALPRSAPKAELNISHAKSRSDKIDELVISVTGNGRSEGNRRAHPIG